MTVELEEFARLVKSAQDVLATAADNLERAKANLEEAERQYQQSSNGLVRATRMLEEYIANEYVPPLP